MKELETVVLKDKYLITIFFIAEILRRKKRLPDKPTVAFFEK